MEFVKDGKVFCVNIGHLNHITIDREYTMLSELVIVEYGHCIMITNNMGMQAYYPSNYFLTEKEYRIRTIQNIINE